MISKSTYEIINSPWEEKDDIPVLKVPPKWNKDTDITVDDVVIWEQIYHQPGNIGIYVAWSPNAEFYLVSYDLFTKTAAGIKTFQGSDAVDRVLKSIEYLNIKLPINRISV
jgi:hypothetical protein